MDLNTEDIMLLHSQSAVGSSPAAVDDEAGVGRGLVAEVFLLRSCLCDSTVTSCSPPPLLAQDDSGQGRGTFRFWHEERRFKGDGSRCLVQAALFAAGGVRTGGHPKVSPLPGPLGWQRPMDWDLLWGPSRIALKALPRLQPGTRRHALAVRPLRHHCRLRLPRPWFQTARALVPDEQRKLKISFFVFLLLLQAS